MRGSVFVVYEVLLWMSTSLVLGIVVGWLIRGWRSEEKLRAAVEEAHAEDLADMDDLAARLAAAEARVAELEAAERDVDLSSPAPDDTGNSGQSEESGQPEETGQPEESGQSEESGQPEGSGQAEDADESPSADDAASTNDAPDQPTDDRGKEG